MILDFPVAVEQGSDAWRQAKIGKVSASRIADLMARTKSGYSTSRAKYMTELVIERLTGKPYAHYVNKSMERGIEMEQFAVARYETDIGILTDKVGFVDHPTIPMSGASPDRLVGVDGLLEVKCPESHTHWETIKTAKIPGDYQLQMLWQLSCAGPKREWVDYVSFDDRFPAELQMFRQRFERNEERIVDIENEVKKFLSELDEEMKLAKKIKEA